MKRLTLLLLLLFLSFTVVKSQTVIFQEGFETQPYGVSSSGNPTWSLNTSLANTGLASYHNQVALSSTSYLTTNSFSTVGNSFVLLEFAHICKIDFFDGAEIEVSVDNGANWTKLTGAEYLGYAQFANMGNRFQAASYPILWEGSNAAAVPTNSWWVDEVFDISTLVANQANVQIRFKLYDGNSTGSGGNYGWVIDDIKVTIAVSELIPPAVVLNTPIVQDSVYGTGPFAVSAQITDASGIASAYIVYTMNGTTTDSVAMVNTIGDTYEGEIPSLPLNTHVNYRVKATDNAPLANAGYSSNYWFYNKKAPAEIVVGDGSVVPAYTLYSPLYRYSSTNSSRYTASNKIYTQAELFSKGIFTGSRIVRIAYYKQGTGATQTGKPMAMQVFMYNSTNTPPLSTSTTVGSIQASHTLVYNNTDHQISSATGWTEVVFDTPFIYSGGNLEVAVFSQITATSSPYSTDKFDWVYTDGYQDYAIGTMSTVALGTGTTLSGTTAQYKHRPNIKFSIDVTSYPDDAGVIQIPSPSGVVLTTSPQPVYAIIKNYGTNNLTAAQISYSVNGVFQQTIPWTGNLAEDMVSSQILLGNGNFINGQNTLKVWTSNPNNTTDGNHNNDTLSVMVYGCAAILSGNYTIGGVGADYATIDDALDAIENCGISGPVVFNIAPGVYTGRLVLGNIPNTSTVNTITFKGTNGTILTHTPLLTDQRSVIALNGAKHFRFDSLTIVVPDTANWGWGIYLGNNTENIEITNCNIVVPANSTSTFYSGIVASGSETSATSLGSGIKNILIQNNTITGGYYGVIFYGSSTSKFENIIINDNSILDSYYYGLRYYYVIEPIATGNYIKLRTSAPSASSGIYAATNDGPFNFSNNTIVNQGQYGMYISGINTTVGNPSKIVNNAIGGKFTNTSTLSSGFYITSSSNIDIYYNSISCDATSGSAAYMTSTASGLKIKNNSFVYSGGGSGYAMYCATTSNVTEIDNNNYYSNGSNFVYYGSGRPTLAILQAVNVPSGNDQNSVNDDPLYISDENLYPLSSILNNGGTPISGITTDITGATRSTTTPDIGAFEYTPVASDIALMDGKLVRGLCLSTNDSLYVSIKNIIGGTVDFSTNPLNVVWNVAGPVNSNGSIILNSGTLAANSTLNFGDDGVDMSVPGIYSLSLYIEPNVANLLAINDSLFNVHIFDVPDNIFNATPDSVLIMNSIDTVALSVTSNMFPFSGFFITEICHYKISTGQPVGGWPLYLIADDYIEITGSPNADLGGYILEQWSTTALLGAHTFSSGTVLSPNGTAIIAVGQMGSSVPSPINFYYHGSGNYSGSFGSGDAIGRIIKSPSGAIEDAVGYGTYAFPVAAGVTLSDWSGNTPDGSSTSGNRLVGAYTKSAANWVNSSTFPQDPNTLNSGVSLPTNDSIAGFSWSLNGVVTSYNNPDTVVGPYTVNGLYQYVAAYNTPCGVFTDTVNVHVGIPPHDLVVSDILTPEIEICYLGNEDVSIVIANIGSDTLFGGFTASYIINNSAPVTENVNTIIPPSASVVYTFTTPIDFNLTSSDTTFYLSASAFVNTDPYHFNDTIGMYITFNYTPPVPLAINDTVVYGNTATLGASSANTVNWYGSPVSNVLLDTGATFTTPVLYGNTSYYASASTVQGGLKNIGTGTFTQSFVPCYGYYDYSWSSTLYLPSELDFTGKIDTIAFYVNNAPSNYTMLDQRVYLTTVPYTTFPNTSYLGTSGMTQVYSGSFNWNGTGWHKIPLSSSFNYDGTSTLLLHWENYDGSYISGQPSFAATTVPSNMVLYNYADIAFPTYTGYFTTTRPNTMFIYENSGCESDRIEVQAIVTGNPPVDAGVVSVDSPLSPTDLQPQPIFVSIKNFGTDTLTNVNINWLVNGSVQMPYPWTGNLGLNQTETVHIGTHTFSLGSNHLVAWTSEPNSVADPMVLNDTASAYIDAFEPLCGFFQIGGVNPNFTNFTDAIYALENYGVSCPVVFTVHGGVYNEQLVFTDILGTSTTNTVSFVGSSNPVISYAPTLNTERHVVLFDGAKHIRLENLTIEAAPIATYGWVLHLSNGCSNIEVVNCNINSSMTSFSTNFAGVVANGSASSATTGGNAFNNLLLENNTINGGYYGILLVGLSSSQLSGVEIINNTLNSQYYYGMYFNQLFQPIISRNSIYGGVGGATTSSSYGMYLLNVGGPWEITKNKISNVGQYGIYISTSSSTSAPSLIANNMIGGGFTNSSTAASGLYLVSTDRINIWYNSINMDGLAGRGTYIATSATNIDMRNNSLAFTGTGTGYAHYVLSGASFITHNYNNYYSAGNNFVYYGAMRSNLSALQSVNNPTGNDLLSKSGNPNYFSATDLHATTAQLYQAAQPISSITDDFDGDSRDLVTPCIGADEFILSPIDAGIVELVNIDPLMNGGSIFNLEVRIMNFGGNPLTTVPVKYSVNGSLPITEIWMGNLAPGASAIYTFATALTIPQNQFTVCAWTQLSNDGNNANDTACGSSFAIPLKTVPFFDDFEGVANFYVTGINNQWQHGVPAASVINTAHSPVNVWATNLTGNYNNTSNYNLLSPRFNLTSTVNSVLGFWHFYNTETSYDGGRIQYSTDNGQSWQTLGTVGDPSGTNWYTHSGINGSPAFSGSSSGWVYSSYDLQQFNNYPVPVQFRFNFFSNQTNNNFNGWAIDDFEIYQSQIALDAGITQIITPASQVLVGSQQNVEVVIKNFGTDPLTSIPVRYRVNSGVPVQETWTGNLLPGNTTNYVFTTPVAESTSFNLCAFTRVVGDTYLNNDTTCSYIEILPAQHDAGVTEILSPGSHTPIGNPVTVSVKIKNFGTQPINTVDVQYDINSGTPTTSTYTGVINPGAEVIHTFTQTYVSPSGNYIFCAKTNLSNEQNTLNDRICKTVTGGVGIDDNAAHILSLGQNMPNPANGNTVIAYNLPSSGMVTFEIVNLLGQSILKFEKDEMPGTHYVEIDADKLINGVYYYTLSFKGQRLTKKMVVNN